MDALEKKYMDLCNALAAFEKAIAMHKWKESTEYKNSMPDLEQYTDELMTSSDSVVKRFELAHECIWKYLKDFLVIVHGTTDIVTSPKKVFRTSTKYSIITERESEHIIDMVDHRNMTSHIYRQEIADLIVKKAPGFLELMQTIFEKCKPSLKD